MKPNTSPEATRQHHESGEKMPPFPTTQMFVLGKLTLSTHLDGESGELTCVCSLL